MELSQEHVIKVKNLRKYGTTSLVVLVCLWLFHVGKFGGLKQHYFFEKKNDGRLVPHKNAVTCNWCIAVDAVSRGMSHFTTED